MTALGANVIGVIDEGFVRLGALSFPRVASPPHLGSLRVETCFDAAYGAERREPERRRLTRLSGDTEKAGASVEVRVEPSPARLLNQAGVRRDSDM